MTQDLFINLNDFVLYLQSKLNCEVLHDDLAFEVRWAVAGESIVIQLVSKLGKFLTNSNFKLHNTVNKLH